MSQLCTPKIIKQLFTPEECQRITDFASTRNYEPGKSTTKKGEKGVLNKSFRRCALFGITDTSDNHWMFERIAKSFMDANNELYKFELENLENIQYTRYKIGDFIHPHFDSTSEHVAKRKLTMSVQLSPSSAYLGGSLQVMTGETPLTAPRGQGDAIIFPTYMLHHVNRIYFGTRHNLVAWIRGSQSFK